MIKEKLLKSFNKKDKSYQLLLIMNQNLKWKLLLNVNRFYINFEWKLVVQYFYNYYYYQ